MDVTKLIEEAGRIAAQAAKQSALDSHYSPCTCSAPPRGHTTRQHDYRRLQVDELRAVLDVVERLTAALKASEEQNKATTISLRCAEANLKAAIAETEPVKSANLAANKRIVELEHERDAARAELAQPSICPNCTAKMRRLDRMDAAGHAAYELDKARKDAAGQNKRAQKAEREAKGLHAELMRAIAQVQELRTELARLTTPQPGEPLDMDCGDNSCMFATIRGGMRTNGGCRCLESLGFSRGPHESLRKMAAEIVSLRKRLADLTTPRPIAEAPRDGRFVLAFWSESTHPHEFAVRWDVAALWSEWVNSGGQSLDPPSHYLPLPEVKP